MYEHLAANLEQVRARIARAAERVGRDPAGVTLVAVTKTVDAETTRALYDLGVRDFGENRVKAGREKVAACAFPPDARWHLIGHLQRDKAGKAIDAFGVIHSVESGRLTDDLQRLAEARGRRVDILLEVNVSGEEAKHGVTPAALPEFFARAASHPALAVRGLMTMAPLTDDPETTRPVFRRLAELARGFTWPDNAAPWLSMGMSGDFEVAIEEGATHVRVGSALFEQ